MLRQAASTVNARAIPWRLSQRMASTHTVQHDTTGHCFIIPLENGENAVVQYKWIEGSVIDLYRTEVPPSYRGKGLAQLLAKAALEFVVEKDAKMVLSCSYLEKFVHDNPLPQYTSRVFKE